MNPRATAPRDVIVLSANLMAEGERELAAFRREAASDKVWEAVEIRLKDIADRRGWEHEAHSQVYEIVARLADEAGGEELRILFSYAVNMRQNYMIESTPVPRLEYEIGAVKEFLAMLDRVA